MEMMIAALKKQGIYENTLIIFTSDNGGLMIKQTLASGHRPSDIYRGGKNQAYEGGYKVPFIASWPAKIKSKSKSDIPVLGLDVMATLAAITGQKIPEGQAMDSSNLLPILTKKDKDEVHPYIMVQSGTGKEVMFLKDRWKLIIKLDKKDKTDSTRKPVALFDLTNNPTEKKNENLINSAKHKELIAELFKTYNETRDSKVETGIKK